MARTSLKVARERSLSFSLGTRKKRGYSSPKERGCARHVFLRTASGRRLRRLRDRLVLAGRRLVHGSVHAIDLVDGWRSLGGFFGLLLRLLLGGGGLVGVGLLLLLQAQVRHAQAGTTQDQEERVEYALPRAARTTHQTPAGMTDVRLSPQGNRAHSFSAAHASSLHARTPPSRRRADHDFRRLGDATAPTLERANQV